MKKFLLLLLTTISFVGCCNRNVITEQQFIDNLNSFDSTAKYSVMDINPSEVSFIISTGDSIFVYHVERCITADAIYISKSNGDYVK